MTSGTPSRLGIDAGLVPSDADAKSGSGGSIGDLVWKDLDRDGHQDGDEPGVGNVTVQAQGLRRPVAQGHDHRRQWARSCSAGWPVATTCCVSWRRAARISPWRTAGADTTADSNADADGWSLCVSVPAGSSRLGVDAGLLY